MKKFLEERARVVREVHAFFESRGFVHVDTPSLGPDHAHDPLADGRCDRTGGQEVDLIARVEEFEHDIGGFGRSGRHNLRENPAGDVGGELGGRGR